MIFWNSLAYALLSLIGSLLLFGGRVFQFSLWNHPIKIEVASIDLFALALFILLRFHKNLTITRLEAKILALWETKNAWKKLPWFFLGYTTLALGVAHAFRHWSLATNAYDLTFLHQPLFHGWDFFSHQAQQPLSCSLCLGGSYLGEHLSWTLFPLSWITSLWPSDFWVFFFQLLIVIWPVFFIFRIPSIGPWLVLALFCSKTFRASLIWDFREDHLAFAFLLFSVLSLRKQKWWFFLASISLALLTKENIGFLTLGFVFPILYSRMVNHNSLARKAIAITVGVLSMGILLLNFKFLIPYWNHGTLTQNNIVQRFPGLGNTPQAVLHSLFTQPILIWNLLQERLLHPHALKYLLFLLGPFGVLVFYFRSKARAWIWLIPALPGLMMNLLSAAPTQRSLEFHYDLIILPFLVGMVLEAAATQIKIPRPNQRPLTLFLLLLVFSGRWPAYFIWNYWPTSEVRSQFHFLHSLPTNHSVAANLQTLAQLSRFKELYPIEWTHEIPTSEAVTDWEQWWKNLPTSDRSQISNHHFSRSQGFVLDFTQEKEKKLGAFLLQKKWLIQKSDPTRRFVWMTAPDKLLY